MDHLFDELDASVEMGSGMLGVAGPPGAGKTHAVLHYLAWREESFSRVPPHSEGGASPCFLMEYWSARSFSNDILSEMSRRLYASLGRSRRAGFKRSRLDATSSEFCAAVCQWLSAHPEGSELHLVVDDVDFYGEGSGDINLWLDEALVHPVAWTRSVYLWFLFQLPPRLITSFRLHFVLRPSADRLLQWLEEDYGASSDTESLMVEIQQFVSLAIRFYLTHQPMCSSITSSDIRLLLQSVYEHLPSVPSLSVNHPAGNALQFARLWASRAPHLKEGREPSLVVALQRVGYTAVLLAFSAFYAGAVPPQHHGVLHTNPPARRVRRSGASPTTANLSSSACTFSASVLSDIYRALLPVCHAQVDPLELASPAWAVAHVLPRLVSWGVVSPTTSRHQTYHCWVPLATAVSLGEALGINLHLLVPV